MLQYQIQEQEQQRKKKPTEEKLEFDPAKVFGPEEVKKDDFNLKLGREGGVYRAQHGEGGTRKGYGYDDNSNGVKKWVESLTAERLDHLEKIETEKSGEKEAKRLRREREFIRDHIDAV